MSNLTKAQDTPIRDGDELSILLGAVKILRGGAVGIVAGTGYAVKYAHATAGMRFVGIALETVDNSAGNAGDKRIRVKRNGLVEFNQSGLTVADIDGLAFLSDDNTLTTTPNELCVGKVVTLDENSGKALVDIGMVTSQVIKAGATGELVGFVGNAATNANAANFASNGNLGTTAYSLGDMVRHFKLQGSLPY